MSNTTTTCEPSPVLTAKSHDDLSWMPILDEFLNDETSIAKFDMSYASKRTYDAVPDDKATRKRQREKERRDQLNLAFKNLHNKMLSIDESYKSKIPYNMMNNNSASVMIHQPYLISKTTNKIESLMETKHQKDAEIQRVEDEIQRLKNGTYNNDAAESEEKKCPKVEKSDEEKQQMQVMSTMMMVPMMVPNMNWMQMMCLSGYNEAVMYNNNYCNWSQGNNDSFNSNGDRRVSEREDSSSHKPDKEKQQESGNLAHCA